VIRELKKFLQIPRAIDRLMFGTDFPIQSYDATIGFVEALELRDEEKEKVYWKNAAKLFRFDAID
jgi:predicted TIM-barrel fold metal-dependent hydrolase